MDSLEEYNGPLFRTKAQAVIQQLNRIPGLVENYQNQADELAEKLAYNREIFEKDREDCSGSVNEQMIQEIQQFEEYVAQNGRRRKEIEELKSQSYEQVKLVEKVIQEALKVEKIIDEWESDDEDDDGPDLEALWSPVIRHFDELMIKFLSFQHGVADKKTEGFLKNIENIYKSGFLRLVVPEEKEISRGILETLELPSETEIWSEEARGIFP